MRRAAQTGFEFKKRRALPVIEGIVVAAPHAVAIREVSQSRPTRLFGTAR